MKRQDDKWCVFLINPLGLTPLWPFCLALPEAVTLVFHLSVIIKSFPFVLSDFGNPRIMVMIYHRKPSNGLPLCWGENPISSQNLQDPVWSHSVCLSPVLSPDFPSTSCAPDTVTRLLSNPQVEQTWFHLWHWHVLLPLQEGLPSGVSWLLSSQPWDSSWGLTPWKCHYWLSHLKNILFAAQPLQYWAPSQHLWLKMNLFTASCVSAELECKLQEKTELSVGYHCILGAWNTMGWVNNWMIIQFLAIYWVLIMCRANKFNHHTHPKWRYLSPHLIHEQPRCL